MVSIGSTFEYLATGEGHCLRRIRKCGLIGVGVALLE